MTDWPYTTCATKRYRDICIDAMERALGTEYPDLNYTKKSVIYQAIVAVLYEDEDCLEVLRKSLAEIEEFRRVDLTEFCIRLATRWPAVQMTLTEKIAGLLDPSS
jgi:hypothetical protein